MQRKQITLSTVAALSIAAAAFAQVNTSGFRHPNLNLAQRDITQAIAALDRAQGANEYDMNGHAQHAKDLLSQADARSRPRP